ncbi:MAG: triosephosphate isomerase [Myxococcota bacterium]|jgi:triosephosphate isomerase
MRLMRRPVIAANWKMQKTAAEAEAFAEVLLTTLKPSLACDIIIAPPFTALDRLSRALGGTEIALAGQNVSAEPSGAHTGEISLAMLAEHGCRYAIVGHSERRAIYGETSALVARKAAAAQAAGICPIVCVGETLDNREAGNALQVVGQDLENSLEGVAGADANELIVAYEPVWAIGTGRTATPEIAQEVHGFIRGVLNKKYGAVADSVRIQYGGSVNPDNVAALMAQPDIDGALVGGASLQPQSFATLIHTAAESAA